MQRLLTIGALREETRISLPTLRKYADCGWIECELDSSGRRLFPLAAIDQALLMRKTRTARKGASA